MKLSPHILPPELLSDLQQNKPDAWNHAEPLIGAFLRSRTYRLTRDPGLIDDLVQETLLAFWQQIQQGRIGQREWNRLNAWLSRLLKLRYRDIVLRKQLGVRRRNIRELTNNDWHNTQVPHHDNGAATLDQLMLHEAIASLDPLDRKIVRWKLRNYSFPEMAEQLSMSADRVRKLYHSAVARLLSRLHPPPPAADQSARRTA